jgi:two-component system LytT family response regulator
MTSPALRLLIVDDEPLARQRTRRLLERIPDVEIVGECSNGREALAVIEAQPPDVLLLDINMPELDGLRVVEALDDPPAVIFATAYEHHAVKAFELEAVDYLLKPFSAERLGRALGRVRRQLEGAVSAPTHESRDNIRVPADTGSGVQMISAEQLVAARIEESVVFLMCADGESLCFAGTLHELEQMLPAHLYLRASRKALVRVDAITRFESTPEGGLHLETIGGHTEEVSRRRARFFRHRLKSGG